MVNVRSIITLAGGCVLLIVALSLFYNTVESNKIYNIANYEIKDVTKVSITNGFTGELIEIENKNNIKSILNCFSNYSFIKKEKQEDVNGYQYSIGFISENEHISEILIVDNETIIANGVQYSYTGPPLPNCMNKLL